MFELASNARPVGRSNTSADVLDDLTSLHSEPGDALGLCFAKPAAHSASHLRCERMVGRGGLEPPTSRLSGVRSNHLSYRPIPDRQA